jgi:hypothetical protein
MLIIFNRITAWVPHLYTLQHSAERHYFHIRHRCFLIVLLHFILVRVILLTVILSRVI